MVKRIFIISFIVLLVDIISKRLVINYMAVRESISLIDNFFSLTYVRNTGVAFSLLNGYVWLIVMMTAVVIVMLFKYVKDNVGSNVELVSYGFILGGAIGNLIDRVVYGYVVDFLDFNIFGYNAPIFNLADCFIVIGVILLIVFSGRKNGDDDEFNSGKES